MLTLAVARFPESSARAETVKVEHNYHWQQTNFWCGTASIEMMLDTPAVRNNNANVDNMFNTFPGDGDLVNGVQRRIYDASRHRRTLLQNNFGFVGYSPGTDPVVFSYTINAYDGIANGPALPGGVAQGGNPAHAYGWYGYFPNLYSGDQAMRTVAYALKNYEVPAAAAVNRGGHWVVVDGVTTQGRNVNGVVQNVNGDIPTPANPNPGPYDITGVYVADPWTGYANTHNQPKKGMGIGGTHNGKENWNWYSYRAWYQFFNPVGGGLGFPYPFSGQYNIVIEPDPDDYDVPFEIDSSEYASEPEYTALPAMVTSSDVLPSVLAGLGGDFSFLGSDLSGDSSFVGGSWDTGSIGFYSFPTDPLGVGSWMIPYVGPGGPNDVLGAIMVNSVFGTIDQAMWMGDDGGLTLAELGDYYGDLFSLDLPLDEQQGVPEPTACVLFLLGAIGLLQRRRCRSESV